MTKLTNDQLEAIRKRAEAATFEKAYVKGDPWKGYEVKNEGNGLIIAETSTEVDADFIAHARTDIPKLLAEIDRLHGILHDAREEIRRGKNGRAIDILEDWGDNE